MTEEIFSRSSGVTPLSPLPADFRAFHQLKRPAYVRWAELHLGSRTAGEEAADRAFEQLAVDWQQILSRENPTAYAWTLLKRRIDEVAQSLGRRPVVADTAAFETQGLWAAVDPVGELERTLSVHQAIRDLPERQHDVVMLRYCLGYTNTETADILGITVPGVRSTARYAKRRLREVLVPDGPPCPEKGDRDDDFAH